MIDAATVAAVPRAAFELAVARLRLRSWTPRQLAGSGNADGEALDKAAASLVQRVSLPIPRVAARLPWRADCLVQALAAERWLGRRGITSILHLGVNKNGPASFAAHAWLEAGGRIVTGGDVAGYYELTR